MNFKRVEEIAEAVLYEGYMLYPYRPSSVKNQQRWNFGVLCPQAYCDAQSGSESSFLQIQCLLRRSESTRLTVKVRFLHIVQRLISKCEPDGSNDCGEGTSYVDRLEVDGRTYRPWQEAVERSFTCDAVDLGSLVTVRTMEFNFPAGESVEPLCDVNGHLTGHIVRRWQNLAASLHIHAEPCPGDVTRISVRVENRSVFSVDPADPPSRDQALLGALVSAHAILGVENTEFISLLEPPASCEDLAHQCENSGAWPVLAGDDASTMLASPIILYDYPRIAPESAGNLFDATEIDEILSLRILALTDEEKKEIRQSDDCTRLLLERTESMPDEQFKKLHGVLRGLTVLQEEPK